MMLRGLDMQDLELVSSETLAHVGSFLDYDSLMYMSKKSMRWSELANSQYFWGEFVRRNMPEYPTFRPDNVAVPWEEVKDHIAVNRNWLSNASKSRKLMRVWQNTPSLISFLRKGACEMVSVDIHSNVRVWSVRDLLQDVFCEELCRFPNLHYLKVTCVASEGEYVYTGGMDSRLAIWNLSDQQRTKAELLKLPCRPTCLVMGEDHLLAGFKDGTFGIIDRRTPCGSCVIAAHEDQINEVVQKDNYIYTCSDDSCLRATDVRMKRTFAMYDYSIIKTYPVKICRSSTHLYCGSAAGYFHAFDLDTLRLKNPDQARFGFLNTLIKMKEIGDYLWVSTSETAFFLNLLHPEDVCYLYALSGMTSADLVNDIHVFSNPSQGALLITRKDHEFLS